jgi:dolichyl-phosphate-mannose-protein mannosyltransferase
VRVAAIVFFTSLLTLELGAGRAGIATAYVDPLARIQAQDEAVYGSTSLGMAAHGGWVTPRFLGRYALYKPPMLYWLSAASVKAFGRHTLALRLPSIAAGAATVTLVFCWLATSLPLAGALAGAVLLLSSHMFFVLSRVALTDALLTFEMTAAMFALARDPRLATRRALWMFGCASGAAIMTKGVAGLFPLLALALFCAISNERPGWARLAKAVAITAAIALPWHLWQLYQHPQWFWAEYVLTEHLSYGLGSPPQQTEETQALYYLKRLVAVDPVLAAGALVAAVRARPRLPICWIVIIVAAVLAFQYRNASYLTPVFPALALLVAGAVPRQRARAMLALALVFFAGKSVAARQTWGIPFAPESVIPAQAALDGYAALSRGNTLILADPDDQFYSADLDLPHVRYVFIDPRTERQKYPLDFEYLGVTVTAEQFARMDELLPVFEQRLREWNLDSPEPVATVILARNEEETAALIVSHPESDFYVPAGWAARDGGVHETRQMGGGRVFLLSRVMVQRP